MGWTAPFASSCSVHPVVLTSGALCGVPPRIREEHLIEFIGGINQGSSKDSILHVISSSFVIAMYCTVHVVVRPQPCFKFDPIWSVQSDVNLGCRCSHPHLIPTDGIQSRDTWATWRRPRYWGGHPAIIHRQWFFTKCADFEPSRDPAPI